MRRADSMPIAAGEPVAELHYIMAAPLPPALADVYGPLRTDVCNGTLSVTAALDAARAVCSSIDGARAGILAGSHAAGRARRYSDLDLYVVVDAIVSEGVDYRIVDGVPIELHLHDLSTLRAAFRCESSYGHAFAAEAFAHGIIVFESDLAAMLRGEAAWWLEKRAAPSADQTMVLRTMLTNAAIDLCAGMTRAETIGCAAKLLNLVAAFVLAQHGKRFTAGRHALDVVRTWDARIAERLESALFGLIARRDAVAVLWLLEELLAPHGGFLWKGACQTRQRAPVAAI